jgi:hypothetical protein
MDIHDRLDIARQLVKLYREAHPEADSALYFAGLAAMVMSREALYSEYDRLSIESTRALTARIEAKVAKLSG